MKITVYLALAVGVGVMIALIAAEDARSIAGLLSAAGWPLLLLVPLQVLPLFLDVAGWHTLIERPVRLRALFTIAAIRQAINRLLPVANVGGDLVGIRLLVRQGVDGPSAAASVIIELIIALAAQFIFALVGLYILMRSRDAHLLSGITFSCALVVSAFAAAFFALRHGQIFSRIEKMAARHLGRWLDGFLENRGASLDGRIRELLANRPRLFRSLAWQSAGLVIGSSETWLALQLLGHPVSVAAAVALESLIQAAKSTLFMVPAGVGVQEAGLIGLGHWFGLDADVALALSLAKRMREILFGLPALGVWQWIEGRRIALHPSDAAVKS
jgi:putative membrane protein